MAKKEHAPHEGLFLKVFKDKENTKNFLQEHLPQGILQHTDLNSLYLENISYLDDSLRKHFSDLVFSVKMGEEEFSAAKVYLLFEHKSSPESLVGMQVLRYMALQWKEMYDQGQIVGGKLPPIIPIVIYQGRGSWQARASFQDLVEQPSESFKEFIPDFSFAFFNIGKVDERKIQENVVLKFYVSIIKALDSPELRDLLPQLTQGFYKSLDKRTALEYIEIFFRYLTSASQALNKEDYQNALELLPEGGENIMNTLAEQWMKEGYERGAHEAMQNKNQWIEEGKKEGKLEATQDNLIDVATEQYGPLPGRLYEKIKAIQSLENLRALTRKAIKTESLDEFTELVNRAAES